MTIEIISDVAFNDPTNLIPYLEKDEAIIRSLTTSMLDFSHPETYSGSGAISIGQTFKSLTSDAAIASALTAYPAVSGGLVTASGVSPRISLPAGFKFATNVTKFMVILWCKLPATGWSVAGGSTTRQLLGYIASASIGQWGIGISTGLNVDAPTSLNAFFPGIAFTVGTTDIVPTVLALSNADTLALCDGNLHQVAIVWSGDATLHTQHREIYVDKVLKAQADVAWTPGVITAPVADCNLMQCGAFQGAYPANLKLGRPSAWNLSGSAVTPTEILARDWDAAQGYLS
jgi:hypothetical protein